MDNIPEENTPKESKDSGSNEINSKPVEPSHSEEEKLAGQFVNIIRTDDIEDTNGFISEETPAEASAENEHKRTKKFVIHVDKENINYFENLEPAERSKIINEFLIQKIENLSTDRKKRIIARTIKHICIVLITIVLGFPLIFYIVNKSIVSSLNSYKYMQVNFERLYQQKAIKESIR